MFHYCKHHLSPYVLITRTVNFVMNLAIALIGEEDQRDDAIEMVCKCVGETCKEGLDLAITYLICFINGK